jgi:hypothetical protein
MGSGALTRGLPALNRRGVGARSLPWGLLPQLAQPLLQPRMSLMRWGVGVLGGVAYTCSCQEAREPRAALVLVGGGLGARAGAPSRGFSPRPPSSEAALPRARAAASSDSASDGISRRLPPGCSRTSAINATCGWTSC